MRVTCATVATRWRQHQVQGGYRSSEQHRHAAQRARTHWCSAHWAASVPSAARAGGRGVGMARPCPSESGRAPRAGGPGPRGTTSRAKGPNERGRAVTVCSSRQLRPRCHGRFNLKPADSEIQGPRPGEGPTKPHSIVCMYTAILWPPAVRALHFERRVDVARWPLKSPRAAIGWSLAPSSSRGRCP